MSKRRNSEPGPTLFEAAETAALVATFPARDDADGLAALYRTYIDRNHAAMLAGDTAASVLVRDDARKLVEYLNAEPRIEDRRCFYDWARWLEELTAAPVGTPPMWGQHGDFELAICGVPARIVVEGLLCIGSFGSLLPHFELRVVDRSRMFFSPTGYRSCFSNLTTAVAGMELVDAVRTYVENMHRGENKGKLHKVRSAEDEAAERVRIASMLSDDDAEDDGEDDDAENVGGFDDGGRTAIGNTNEWANDDDVEDEDGDTDDEE